MIGRLVACDFTAIRLEVGRSGCCITRIAAIKFWVFGVFASCGFLYILVCRN